MIKVALTDDHEMVLKGLRQMLSEDPECALCGVYHNGRELLEGLAQQVPDVLLLDLHLPDYRGEELALTISQLYPDIKILVLSSIDDAGRVMDMLQKGCKGYSLKNISQESLSEAIKLVHRGEEYIDPVLQKELVREALVRERLRSSPIPDVTRREKEILLLMADGYSSKDIADRLFLSVRTVDNHRKSLLQKFNVKNALALLKLAKDHKILQ